MSPSYFSPCRRMSWMNTRGAFLSGISISATRIESRGWSRATGNKRRHWRMASVILREQFPTRPPPLEFYSFSSREIIFSSGTDSENIGGDHRIRITQTTEEERASCTDTPATRGHVRAPSAELCRTFHVFRPIMRLRVRGNLETTTRSSNEFVRGNAFYFASNKILQR